MGGVFIVGYRFWSYSLLIQIECFSQDAILALLSMRMMMRIIVPHAPAQRQRNTIRRERLSVFQHPGNKAPFVEGGQFAELIYQTVV
ncbi:MAG: hypothetical protein V1799_12745 [bacterium]